MLTAQTDDQSAAVVPAVSAQGEDGRESVGQNAALTTPSLQEQMTNLNNAGVANTDLNQATLAQPAAAEAAAASVVQVPVSAPVQLAPPVVMVGQPAAEETVTSGTDVGSDQDTPAIAAEPQIIAEASGPEVQALADQVANQLQDLAPTAAAAPAVVDEVPAAAASVATTATVASADPSDPADTAAPPTPLPAPGPSTDQPPTNTFFDVLVNKGKITQQQAQALVTENLNTGSSLEQLLLDKKLVSPAEITQAKAEFYNIDYIDLNSVGADPEALNLIDEVIAKRYKVLPFALDKAANLVKVAMDDPLDLSAVEFLKQKTGHEVKTYFAESAELQRSIAERYSQSLSSEVTEALKTTNQYQVQKQEGVAINMAGQILRDAPINRIVENILDFAMKARASDVHIEPQIGRIRVRYRIDGILTEKLILPKSVHEAIISRIKILSNLKIDEKRLPQDGRFNYVSQGKEVDLRISTLPTVHGEKVVMRLLEKNTTVPSLEELGLTGLALQHLKDKIKVPHGIVLITGPTGSGKTTTLYSILHMINNIGVNIMTLEDPVEYQIPGINQVQVNVKAGLTFASGLRSFLRQDPNVIMVGEVRDNETADLAIQASLTGHLVFSTLHTNSAAGALPRLMDMQAEPFLLASSMLLTMGQRVVRKINAQFVEEYKPEAEVLADIKQVLGVNFDNWCRSHNKKPEEITLFRPKADRPSTEPDYKGRIGIFEVMPITLEISKLILERASSDQIEEMAIQQGMLLMKQDGYLKALDGVTTIEEVLRVAEVQ